MKIRLALGLAALLGAGVPASAAELIRSASNLRKDKVTLVIHSDHAKAQPRNLVRLDLKAQTAVRLPWPEKIGQEEVLGLLQLENELLLISQWTSGDGKKPQVHRYSWKDGKWGTQGEISCLSFENVELKDGALTVECETDPQSNAAAGPKTLNLPVSKKESLRLNLPVISEKQGNSSFSLKGEMFRWESIEILQPGKKSEPKTLMASDILKKAM